MNKINYNPDILSCLANLSNDEVFTPPDTVNKMLDLLPKHLFKSTNTTFLDPACKSGVFLREIAKRLNEGIKNEIPDTQQRINHIFKNQLFGIAITELTSLLSRRTVYCSTKANGKYSVTDNFGDDQGNIIFNKIEHSWRNGNCEFCGANRDSYDRESYLETHAYMFIHTDKLEEIFNMKFDVIIGNPPYQISDGGSGTGISAKPIFHKFIEQAIKLKPSFLCMITPSRWFSGGKGLDGFREKMLRDKRFKVIHDFYSSKDCFPGVNIAGGINYFLWEKNYHGKCYVINHLNDKELKSLRYLDEHDIFIRDNQAIEMISKILNKKNIRLMSDIVYSRNPFGFVSSERGSTKKSINSVKLVSSGGEGFVERDSVKNNNDLIDKFKVIIGKVVPSNGEIDVNPEDGYRVITSPRVLDPGSVHTETYILLNIFDNELEANNFQTYMKLKLPRFLLRLTLSSMNISVKSFSFVPYLNYDKLWNDEEVYRYFDLTANEIEHVQNTIRDLKD